MRRTLYIIILEDVTGIIQRKIVRATKERAIKEFNDFLPVSMYNHVLRIKNRELVRVNSPLRLDKIVDYNSRNII